MYIQNLMNKSFKNSLLVCCMLLFVSLRLFGQTKQTLIADMLLDEGRYQTAIELYREAEPEEKKKDYIYYKMASCFNLLFLGDSALFYIDKAMALVKYPTVSMYKQKGHALQLLYKFDDAIKHYNKADPRRMDPIYIPKYIGECEYGKKYLKRPVKVTIHNIGETVNSRHHDLLPKITADGRYLYFASYPSKEEVSRNNLQDVFRTIWDGNAWGTPVKVEAPISDIENNDAVVGLSPDGQQMFIFRGINGGDILMSELKGGKWSTPVSMPFNTAHKESSITISPDGKTLLFVRKSKGGNGNIYECKKLENGEWSTPVLLSKTINSRFDEESPFLHPDGKTLYFSSKGHTSMGGYDIFKSTLKNGGWTTPINIGYPVNTTGDDFCFVLSADSKKGFYSSQRADGFGGQDIYELNFKGEELKAELTLMQGVVTEKLSGKLVEATVLIWDNEAKKEVATFQSQATTGEYLIALPAGKNYAIIIEQKGFLFHSENVLLPIGEGYRSVEKNIELVALSKGERVQLNNVFFESGKATLSELSNAELNLVIDLLNDNPTMKIEIGGFTDNVGDEKSNLNLSQQRADIVVEYIVTKGIEKERVMAKGYGEAHPLGDNNTEEGRRLNRRTELKILE